MPDPFDLTAYLGALAARWKSIAVVAVGAAAVAFGVSMLLPTQYEATVLISIQPGMAGASNPAAMSPAYLDSLRSYEQWLQSEGLVATLLQSEKLGEFNVESFRRSALRVTLGKGTRTLQVSVRMSDPKRAHDAAVKLAEIAVAANTSVGRAESDQARASAELEVEAARKPLLASQTALEQFNRENRSEEAYRQVEVHIENKSSYQTQLMDTKVRLAEQEARLASLTTQIAKEPEKIASAPNPLYQDLRAQAETARTEAAGLRARRDALLGTLEALEPALARGQAQLATLESRRHALERDYQAAELRFKALGTRATDSGIAAGMRHEDLQIADPGVTPTRPVSPRPLLNTALGALFGLLAGLLYETYAWNRTPV
jgi:uncharacterized protein involved in exopolysaccharide biosynthesis